MMERAQLARLFSRFHFNVFALDPIDDHLGKGVTAILIGKMTAVFEYLETAPLQPLIGPIRGV
jgi:hypothetical protein